MNIRQEVKAQLNSVRGLPVQVIVDGKFIDPDCLEFSESHIGVEPPPVNKNRIIRSRRNRQIAARTKGEW